MPSLTSRNQPGRREDISDVIAVVDARQTEVSSMIPKGPEPTNPLMSWQMDDYLEPQIVGVVEDKDRTEFENHVGRVPLSGRIQITERAPKVSRIAQKVSDVAGVGRKKEFAKSVAKAITVAKRDIECRILCDDDSQEDNGVVGYETRGLFRWASATPQADLPVPENARTPATSIFTGAWSTLNEQTLRETILGSIWDETGTMGNFQMVVGRQLKALITGWTIYAPNVASNTVIRTFQSSDATVLRASVDRIEGDFGSLELRTSPWLRRDLDLSIQANKDIAQRSGIIFDADNLEIRYNERPNFRAFEDQGGGPRGLVEAIWGLVVFAPKSLAKVAPTAG
jgi:hypothetical protein